MIETYKAPLVPEVIPLKPRGVSQTSKPNLIGMTRSQMGQALIEIDTDPKTLKMRVSQLWSWIYQKGFTDFSLMSNLSKDYRSKLSNSFHLRRPKLLKKELGSDGTTKFLLELYDGNKIETVYIPERNRGTVCISSQVGCTLNCSFCHTGTQKLVRNLSSEEIVSQILFVKDELSDWSALKNQLTIKRLISNIVIMGMGEPLYNFESVRDALKIVMDCEGVSISKRKITLSTSGVVPNIVKVGEEIGCLLAVSFHATTDEVRNRLVPINKKWNIDELLNTLKTYPTLSNTARITFEYVMLRDVNDSDEDAKRLVQLISGIPAKINLIPFNSWPGTKYKGSSATRISSFSKIVNNAGYSSPIRHPRGLDIMAACGQLKSASKPVKRLREVKLNG